MQKVWLAVLAYGLAASPAAAAIAIPSPTILLPCGQMRQVAAGLRLEELNLDLVRPSLGSGETRAGATRLARAYTLKGECAGDVQAFQMGVISLSYGMIQEVERDGARVLQPRQEAGQFYGAMTSEISAPSGVGGVFAGAARVGGRRHADGGLEEHYLGLWRDSGSSVIAAFSKSATGAYTAPLRVLTSTLPLRSLSYFPSPDSPSGRIGLVQETADGPHLLSLDWHHPDAYRP